MSAYILTWNPDRWPWKDLEKLSLATKRGELVTNRWSTGVRRNVPLGSRLYLLKQGEEPRGLIASGYSTSPPYSGPHWDDSRKGDEAHYVDGHFDAILDPDSVLPKEDLIAAHLDVNWDIQGGGIHVPEKDEKTLENLWRQHLESAGRTRISFEAGKVYQRRELHDQYGGTHQSGISPSKDHPIIFLFTGESGKKYGYNDGFQDDGTYFHAGHGQHGDMKMESGNLAVLEHEANGKALHLFEAIGDGQVLYIGEASYLDHHIEPALDREGKSREAIIFELEILGSRKGNTTPRLQKRRQREKTSLWKKTLDELRDLAAAQAPANVSAQYRKTVIRKRSEAVRVYVLKRANGICEGCGKNAPFQTPNGQPYLEPHHTLRLADDGPDHPRWVAAICPNCHARVHYGKDGDAFNAKLIEHLADLESDE